MELTQARILIEETFKQAFDKGRFLNFIRELLNHFDESKAISMQVPDAFAAHVRSCRRLGTYESPDGELADVLIVNTTEAWKLERTRTGLRDFVAHKLKRGDSYKEAGLIAFVSPDARSWRFSFVRMEYQTKRDEKTGKIAVEETVTPARRFSYIVGESESCHTAQTRFVELLTKTNVDPSLVDIEKAFSVEAVTKEFFNLYADLFTRLDASLEKLTKKDKTVAEEFKARNISTVDFSKKLLGQIVFLYFLQKKGWLGVEKGKDWGDGPRDFLRQLADHKYISYDNFFNDVLEPLFFDTLATDRGHDAWCKTLNCRIPFLNGGLFEPLGDYDWRKTDIALPNKLFTNTERVEKTGDNGTGILDVFDRYNFTVNEAEPLEKEVAIDPEMLGKVFENLIEENRRKGLGSYYTPREIVHYMCQESLINYLDTAVNTVDESVLKAKPKQPKLLGAPEPEQIDIKTTGTTVVVPRVDLETFVHLGDQISHYEAVDTEYRIKMPKSIIKHAKLIDEKLKDITVCDPAVGSGAFPVGMMNEIVRCRSALTTYFNDVDERTAYHFKRHAIQTCLYGVDIDPGAVEIAKLRLWLSLVVDEEDVKQIKPLPNLFYKIVSGNSLIGFPFKSQGLAELEQLKERYFFEPNHDKKAKLKQQIDNKLAACFASSKKSLGYEVDFDFKVYFSEVFRNERGFDVLIANPPYVFGGGKDIGQEDKKIYKRLYVSGSGKINLFALFVERGAQLLRKQGSLVYILPNTLLRVTSYIHTRRFIIEHMRVHKVIDLDVGVFDSVTASTIIISLLNETPEKRSTAMIQRGCDDTHPGKVLQCKWTNNGYILDIFSGDKDRTLFDKLGRDSKPLKDFCSRIRFGVVISGNLDEVVRQTKHGSDWKPFLEGDEIGAFVTRYRGRYLHYKKNLLHRSRTPDIFEIRKIMIQRITGGDTPLKATLDDQAFYNKESILNLILSSEAVSYEYILAVLNSKLANWFYKRRFTNSSKLTVNLSKEYVGQIPVKLPTESNQKTIERLVNRVLTAKARDATANTSALEKEIDDLVYKLYDLTPEEIAIVEESSHQ
jgi:type I restriction-modification system DNA methylase subunit